MVHYWSTTYTYNVDGNTPFFEFNPSTSDIDNCCSLSVYNIYNSNVDPTTPTDMSSSITDNASKKRVEASVNSAATYTFVIKVSYTTGTHYEYSSTITFNVVCSASSAPSWNTYGGGFTNT
jgi:hypothetical protein